MYYQLEKPLVCIHEYHVTNFAQRRPTQDVLINPGGILTYRYTLTDSDSYNDLDVEHLDEQRRCCSLTIMLYFTFFESRDMQYSHFGVQFIGLKFYGKLGLDLEFVSKRRYKCVCNSSFGVNKEILSRTVFSNNDFSSYEFPYVFNLIPSSDNNTTPIFSSIPFCWNDETEDSFYSSVCRNLESILINQNYTVYTHDLIIFCWFMAFIVFLIGMLYFLRKFYTHLMQKYNFYTTTPQKELSETEKTKTDTDTERMMYQYDFYLLYTCEEEEDRRIAELLRNHLESSGKRVYDFYGDFQPGTRLEQMGKAIENSERFVVVSSETFWEDRAKKFEFDTIQSWIIDRGFRVDERILNIESTPIISKPPMLSVCASVPSVYVEAMINSEHSDVLLEPCIDLDQAQTKWSSGFDIGISCLRLLIYFLIFIFLIYFASFSPLIRDWSFAKIQSLWPFPPPDIYPVNIYYTDESGDTKFFDRFYVEWG